MKALAEIVGDSPGIRQLRGQLEQILTHAATAPRPPSILICGETGTGKGLVTRILHRAGARADAPFIDVNCAAIPETLLEAELFGHERGAFTNARQAKPGLFQVAHRGVLFLDEIGMLSPALQAKLLKVVEDGLVRRLGGTRAEPVDVWIVSATNEDLTEALQARRFREDLYHRLAVLSLELPPLRERGADILLLAERFLAQACADYGLPPKTLSRDARVALGGHGWPGNVRELGNTIERAVLLADEPVITAAMLALPVQPPVDGGRAAESVPVQTSRDQMRAHLLEVLTETGGNISQTAVRLGVARNTVLSRIARFGLNRSTVSSPPRSRPGDAPPRDEPETVRVSRLAIPRRTWELRRVALLRVDVVAGAPDGSRALDDMIGKIQMFQGDVIEEGPSAFVAAFGLQTAEDAPVRAALAALAILKATERAHRDVAGQRVKLVLHVAQLLVSPLHGAGMIDLESQRPAWKTIDALADPAPLDTIVVSEASAPFLERRFELASASVIDATGVPFRRLVRRERTGFGLGGRPLARFVGRDGELRLVGDRLGRVARGQGQVMGIVGEPGVGKSRFVYEVTRLDATRDWRLLGCGGVSHGSTTPLLPIGDLLRGYFAIEDEDGPEAIREKVAETVRFHHAELKSYLAPVLSLLDIPVDDPSWKSLDPPRRRQQMQDAVKRIVIDESRIQPLLLIVEDLHWADAETRALLDGLVDSVPRARVGLIVTYRPEHEQTWGQKSYYTQIRIDPLPVENARVFLGALLGEHETLDGVKRLLIERTEGNPLFLEEGVRALVESQALAGAPGAYRATRPVETVEVPATVEAILAGRIDRLRPEDRRLLQSAAVIGRDIPFALLRAISDQDDAGLRDGLARLQATEFLYETRIVPELEYTFKHALTHDVAYRSLLEERRRALHAAIVDAIEALYSDRLGEHVERLADHALLGRLRERAVPYLRQAGLKAVARSAPPDARAWFERALEVLETLPESPSTLQQAFDTRLELRPVLLLLAEVRRALERLREAEALAGRLNDDRRRSQVYALMMNIHTLLGELDEALLAGTRALEIAERLGDWRLRVPATTLLEHAHYFRGEHERVVALATDNIAALPAEWVSEYFGFTVPPSVLDRCWLIQSLAELGRFAEAAEPEADAIRLAALTERPFTVGWAYSAAGTVHLHRGDWAQARPLFERAIAVVLDAGNVAVVLPMLVAGCAWALAQLGETSAALSRMRQGEKLLDRQAARGFGGALSGFYQHLGRAALVLGQVDEARRLCDRAVDSLASQPGFAAHAQHLLGDVATHSDRFDAERGLAHYHRALALAEPRGMRPLVAHCHAGLGRLFVRMCKHDEAGRHLTTAATMYGEMEMTYWLEKMDQERTGGSAGL